jgi:hypothetical protein
VLDAGVELDAGVTLDAAVGTAVAASPLPPHPARTNPLQASAAPSDMTFRSINFLII